MTHLTPTTTPEPRDGGGMPAPRLSSSLARGWRLVWPWIADVIGAISLFVALGGGLVIAEAFRP